MAFVQQLECDQIEEPSILWKLPLLLLSAVIKQSNHRLLFGDFTTANYTTEDCYNNKWKPSLPTIEEEEKAENRMESSNSNNNNSNSNNNANEKKTKSSFWQAALLSAGAILPKQKRERVLLGIFVSCCSPFVPVALW